MIPLTAADFMQEDAPEDGFQILDLNDAGLEGWEVVNVLPRRQFLGLRDESSNGAYVFLRKELSPDEAAELEKS